MCMRENIFFLLLPLQFGILYEALLAYSVLLLESGCSSQAPVYHSEYELGVLWGRGADNRWLRTSEEHTNISSLTAELPPKRISGICEKDGRTSHHVTVKHSHDLCLCFCERVQAVMADGSVHVPTCGPQPWQGCRVAVWFSLTPWSIHRWLAAEFRIWRKQWWKTLT